MTLKEQFKTINCKDCGMPYCDISCTILKATELDVLEQIADNYAISFAEWCGVPVVEANIKELLEIYKKTNKL
jgi:hypothetical protein